MPYLPQKGFRSPSGGEIKFAPFDVGIASLAPSSALKSTSAQHFDTMLFLHPASPDAAVPDAWAPLSESADSRPLLLRSLPCLVLPYLALPYLTSPCPYLTWT